MAGIAAYVKALKPNIKVIGVEPTGEGAGCTIQYMQTGEGRERRRQGRQLS